MAWVAIAIQLGIAAVSLAVNYALREKGPPPEDLPEFNPGDQIPKLTESDPIPVVFGTRMIADPNVVFIGDSSVTEEAVSTGPGNGDINYGTKVRYRLDLVFAVCVGPIDIIHRVDVDGRTLLGDLEGAPAIDVSDGINDITQVGEIDFFKSNIFDFEKDGDDGVAGWIDTVPGRPANDLVNYQKPDGTTGPVYPVDDFGQLRNICSVTLRGAADRDVAENLLGPYFYHGTSPRLRPWRFFVQRMNRRLFDETQWYPSTLEIETDVTGVSIDMNPAHIAWEVLVDHAGFADSDIDDTSFRDAADLFEGESLGMSMLWNAESSYEDIIKEIERTTDSIVRWDPTSESWKWTTIREVDYSAGGLPTFNESNVIAIDNMVKLSHHDLPTTVELIYWDRAQVRERAYTVDNQAAILARGRVIKETRRYSGIVARTVAAKIAHRDLQQLSAPRVNLEMTVPYSEGNTLQRGDAFVLSWPEYDLVDIGFRVVSIDYGKLEDGIIRVEATSDSIRSITEFYDPPQDSEHPDPQPIGGSGDTYAVELPLWLWNETKPIEAYEDLPGHVFQPASVNVADVRSRPMYLQARPRTSGANPDFRLDGYDLFERKNLSNVNPVQVDRSSFSPTVYVTSDFTRDALFGGEIPTVRLSSRDWVPQVGDLILFRCDNPLINPTITFSYDSVNDPGGSANANVNKGATNQDFDFDYLDTLTEDICVVVSVSHHLGFLWDVELVRGCCDTSPGESISAPATVNLEGYPEGFVIGRINVTEEDGDEWFEAGGLLEKKFCVGEEYIWRSENSDSPTEVQQRGLIRFNGRELWSDASGSEETPTLGETIDVFNRSLNRVAKPFPAGAVQVDDDSITGVSVFVECRNRLVDAFVPAGLVTYDSGIAVNDSGDWEADDLGWEDTAANVQFWWWDGTTGDILLVQSGTSFGAPEVGATAGFSIAEEQAMHNALHGTSQQFDKIRYAVVVTNADPALNSEFTKLIPCYMPFFGMIDRT